jgi:DNA adenine methylase
MKIQIKDKVIPSPFRWAGSKKRLLNELLTIFDKKREIYVEPFLGSRNCNA